MLNQIIRAASTAIHKTIALGWFFRRPKTYGAHAIALTLVSDGRHIQVHSLPEQRVLLLDVLAPAVQDSQRALDVFTRRLTPRDVRSDTRERPPRHHRPRG